MECSYWIGIVAGVLFVVGYAGLNFGLLKATSPIYQTLNLFGALGFTYTAISPFNPGLFILEVVWALVAFYGLIKIWKKRSNSEADAVAPNIQA